MLVLSSVCVFLCLVPGDDHPEQQVCRVNPGRATSKRYRTFEPAGGSSSTQPPPAGTSASAPPPPQQSKRSSNKPKGKTMTEMTAKEFWAKRRRNSVSDSITAVQGQKRFETFTKMVA